MAKEVTPPQEICVDLWFDRRADGRYHVHSPNVTGLNLAGMSLDDVQQDIEPAVMDLLRHNHGIHVENIRWIPALEEITEKFKDDQIETKKTYIIKIGHAA